MRKFILILILPALINCAGKIQGDRSGPGPDCERATSPTNVTWPDEEIRKSVVMTCTFPDGVTCDLIAWVDDETLNFNTCPNGYL